MVLVMSIDDFKHILQSDPVFMGFVVARSDSEEVSVFENVLVLCRISDIYWCCGENEESDTSVSMTSIQTRFNSIRESNQIE